MALSPAQLRSGFEIASVIYQDFTTAQVHDGFGTQITIINLDTLQGALNTYLTTLTSDSEAKVIAIIAEWDACVDLVGSMSGGNVGSITGLSYTFDELRARITKRFQTYVPVMHIIQAEARKAGQQSEAQNAQSNSFRIMR